MQVRKVRSSLKNKGFRERFGHHVFLVYHDPRGLRTGIITKISHGASPKDLPSAMVGTMAQQCGLSIKEFRSFVECTMTYADFEKRRLSSTVA